MNAPRMKQSPTSSNGGQAAESVASGGSSSYPTPAKILACVACRNSKVKCHSDGPGTCKRCLEHHLTCIRPEYQRLKKVKANLARFQQRSRKTKDVDTKPMSDLDESIDEGYEKPPPPQESPTVLFSSNALYGRSAQLLSNLHIVRPDIRHDWDPVSVGIMDVQTSRELFTTFMLKLEPLLSFFDPRIHSYDYVKRSSSLLFSTMCWLAATVSSFPTAEHIMHQLKAHIDTVLLPAIYCHNLRSVEIAQGFLMLAAYLRPAQNPSEDRSWTLLGHAIRTATDLDMHSRILSTSQLPQHPHMSPAESDSNASPSLLDQSNTGVSKTEILHQRNKERAWMHIWLHEASSSQYTGRVSLLAKDPIIDASQNWHLHPEALHTDVVFVALIQLRTLLAQNKELFRLLSSRDNASMQATNGRAYEYSRETANKRAKFSHKPYMPTADAHSSWIRHYLDRCHRDLTSWEERWVNGAARSGSQPRPLRLELGSLYICYARMQLLSLPLQSPSLQQSLTTRIVSDLHTVSMRYLEDFLERTSPQRLAYSYNSICVTATYAVVIALKLTRLAPSYSFINSQRILHFVTQVSKYLREGGNLTEHQNGSSLSYARYIDQMLDKESSSNVNSSNSNISSVESTTSGGVSAHDGNSRDGYPSTAPPMSSTQHPHPVYPSTPNTRTFTPLSNPSLSQAGPFDPPSLSSPHAAQYQTAPTDANLPQWSFLANDPELFAWARSFLDDELDIPATTNSSLY